VPGISLLAEREAERAQREAERAERERMQGLLAFVQQLGQQQGLQIPAQLLAPPRPPPPPRRESTPVTPVSISTIVLLFVLMLSVKPSVGLRA
jgi:hypothetical protein